MYQHRHRLNNWLWERKMDILKTAYRQSSSIWSSDQTFVTAYRVVLCSKAYKALSRCKLALGYASMPIRRCSTTLSR